MRLLGFSYVSMGGWIDITGPRQAGLGWKFAIPIQVPLVSRFDF